MKLDIEIDETCILGIAKEMGYQEYLQDGNGVAIPNPQSAEDYIEMGLANMLVGMSFKKDLEQEANDFVITRRVTHDTDKRSKVTCRKKRDDGTPKE